LKNRWLLQENKRWQARETVSRSYYPNWQQGWYVGGVWEQQFFQQ